MKKSKEQYKSREAFDERVAKQLKSLAEENQKLKQQQQKVIKLINGLKEHRDDERKNNNIFRKSSDELNDDFISNLDKLEQQIKKMFKEEFKIGDFYG